MAKLTGKEGEVKNTTTPETNEVKEMPLADQKNAILEFLKEKNQGEWTPEEKIERHFDGKIHYYQVRQLLPYLLQEGHLEFTTFQLSYKLSFSGREFLQKGGYTA